ncbi:hypothetical protein os1_21720 [Comamonadaceae bacterium OS-1]|nr:hypothetical protein os1_21720 [Comamonadaceae bacterium OS-1]
MAYQLAANGCTTLQERAEYAKLPVQNVGYLTEKVRTALKFPKIVNVKLKSGEVIQALLQQHVVSAAILLDETKADFFWQYKSEVSFDMTPTLDGKLPKPFLQADKSQGPLRRHTLNRFPPGLTRDYLRRPDVIIVKNPALRWPGLATTDHEGFAHPDNIARVVELKFPNDTMDPAQERAYRQIAGGSNERLCIVDVQDCDGDLARVREAIKRAALLPAPDPKTRVRAPVRSVQPIAEPAWYELWLNHPQQEAQALWSQAQQGVSQLSAQAQAWLKTEIPWLFGTGRWVCDTYNGIYQWVDAQGRVLARWTTAQLRYAKAELARQTDLTLEQIDRIEWGQLVIDVGTTICGVAIVVLGALMVLALSPYLLAALAALMGIQVALTTG